MNIINSIKSFMYDKNYFINISNDGIYIFNYNNILRLNDNKIIVKFDKFNLIINGNNLIINKLVEDELSIIGSINNMEFQYE